LFRSAGLPVLLVRLVDSLLNVPDSLSHFTFDLLRKPLRLLRLVTYQFANLSLDFAGYIFGSARDLITIHGVSFKLNARLGANHDMLIFIVSVPAHYVGGAGALCGWDIGLVI
jgi:hypothetical protein